MRAEFQAFSSYVDGSNACVFEGDTVESEIFNESIDAETASSVNYYKIEGRIATFSIPLRNDVYDLLLNRKLYKNVLSSELTRIGVKIYNDDDVVVFFGVLAYGFTLDDYAGDIIDAKVYDIIYIINKYWHNLYTEREITSDDYSLTEAIEIALGNDENSPYEINRYLPFGINFNYIFDVNYSGFETSGAITINSNWDIFYNDGQALYVDEEEVGIFGANDDVDIANGQDYNLHRRISYGFTNLQDRLDLTFMFYEYRSQRNPNQDGTVDAFDREKINMRTYIFTPGAQYSVKHDIEISRAPSDDYETMELEGTRLIDTEFFARGYDLEKESYIDFLDDFYVIAVVGAENTNLSGWNILFNGTVAQDIIRFNQDLTTNENGTPIVTPANLLAGLMLINNLTLLQNYDSDVFEINVKNKLKTVNAEPVITLEDNTTRSVGNSIIASSYDDSLLDQFIFGVSVKSIVNNYYTALFNKYCVAKDFIFAPNILINIGDSIKFNGIDYVIMTLDRSYDTYFYKATCYGEE